MIVNDPGRLSDIRRDIGEGAADFEFQLLAAGIEPSVDDEVAKGGGWHLGGRKGLRHWVRKKKGKGMTKQEAMLKIALAAGITVDLGRIEPQRREEVENFVVCLEALGLIKFDEPPKTAIAELLEKIEKRGLMVEVTPGGRDSELNRTGYLTSHGAGCVIDFMEAHGFEIRRKA